MPLLLAVLLLSVLAPGSAAAVDIRATRYWSGPDHTRIVIDLGGPSTFQHRTVDGPPRIAIDVDGGRFRLPGDTIPIEDGLVKRIRFNELQQSGKGQIVLDLDRESSYDIFALEPYKTKPHRIVVDVKRAVRRRPPPPSGPRPEARLGPDSFGDFLVLIDAGHGGEDPGRINPDGTEEKTLALQFSRDLKMAIDAVPGYRAALTRNGDYFVSLGRRREIAEERGAHLFVSLHFNAAASRSAHGTEIFFVSMRGAEKRMLQELVEAENSADLIGGLPPADEETSTDLTRMIADLRQSDSVERSQELALVLTDHVSRVRGITTRPVRQAGFAVLKSLFMPAVLVEIGFLSNRDDLRFVRSGRNRGRYVRALADGILEYCEKVEIPRLGWTMHIVRRGDSLSRIAVDYAMTLDTLKSANGLSGDRIRVGQKLRVRPR